MSADRDYWTELKQLLRWFITPGLPHNVEFISMQLDKRVTTNLQPYYKKRCNALHAIKY